MDLGESDSVRAKRTESGCGRKMPLVEEVAVENLSEVRELS